MELTPVFIWWSTILIFGLIGWPLAFSLFRRLPDRGFAFARSAGLLISGYILWLGGTFRLLQNNVGGILTAMILTLIVGLVWHWRQIRGENSPSALDWLRQEWRYALTVELLFAVAFVAWDIFKAYNPNIDTAGGEKWMEIAFINGTLRSDYFPPQDPWLSGFAISYYYFGYVLMAMVTQLTGLLSVVAFNLYVPTLFAMTLTAALGIVANLVSLHQSSPSPSPNSLRSQPSNVPANQPTNQSPTQPPNNQIILSPNLTTPAILTGLVGSLFVAILGHLEGLLEVLHQRGLLPASFWTWLDIRDLKVPPAGPGDSWIPDRFIWWWRGSRVLTDYTLTGHEQEVIDEFPFFSFLLGDVHPHVLALPFVLLVVALALNLIVNGDRPARDKESGTAAASLVDRLLGTLQESWQLLTTGLGGRLAFVIYAVCLGGLSFLNTWDFPIYLSVVGLTLILWVWYRWGNWSAALTQGIIGTLYLGLAGIILYLPFYATFQSQARGLLPNLWNPTRLPQFFVFFGPFLAASIILLLVFSGQSRTWKKNLGWTLPLTILGPVLLMLVVLSGLLISPAGREYVQGILNNPEVQQVLGNTTVGALVQESLWRRVTNPWTFLLLGALLGWSLALFVGEPTGSQSDPTDHPTIKFVLILLLVGLGLPLAVEFIYLRDNFGIRMNTIFKFYFQAWVLLALVSAFAVYYVSKHLKGIPALLWQLSMILLVAAGMIYPVLAIADKTSYFQGEPTLNGIAWIADQRPSDYAAIAWLRANAPDDAVILEAPGASYAAYQYTGRVSALTGLPTLLGWGGHESQWRGNYDEPARREPDIEALFNTSDLRQARQLLDKYNITYVYVGPLERERYSPQGLNKFERLMDVVFQQDDVTIYRRR